MVRGLVLFAIWALLGTAAQAACTPQIIADMQARGAAPQFIAQMCGTTTGAPAAGATVCATSVGVCPFRGAVNVPCTCAGPTGSFQGVSR
ncbi:MAG: hypothetical protein ACTHLO_05895 [Pseudolabrys sp.]